MNRSLTDSLRTCSAEELAELLQARPDLAAPVPADVADLAGRAITSASVRRAVDRLNQWDRDVCEALASLPVPCSSEDVRALLGADADPVEQAIERLRRLALLWGTDPQLHLVRHARSPFEPYPAGLAPVSPTPLTSTQLDQALEEAGPDVTSLLHRLSSGNPTGAVRQADRPITLTAKSSPVERALATSLIRALDANTVIVRREVALRMRGDTPLGRPLANPSAPKLRIDTKPQRVVDNGALGAALTVCYDIELACEIIDRRRPQLLRDGGLSARDATALSKEIDSGSVGDVAAALAVEIAAAADLLGRHGPILTPTPGYDVWLSTSLAARWFEAARGWLLSGRWPSASVSSGAHLLGGEADLPIADELRGLLVSTLAELPPGTRVDAAQLTALIAWHRPTWSARVELGDLIEEFINEAGAMGVLSMGCVASLTSAVLDSELAAATSKLFPQPVDQIIIQADLTAVAPGPLEPTVARPLRQLAEQESRGGGGVFRFTEKSLRRGFDLGWNAQTLQAWLAEHSSTGVPQPLLYLIADLARRHGQIRVGPAGAVINCDDPAQVAALLAHPAAAALSLHSVGEGVIVSPADPDEVVIALRNIGLSPTATDSSGQTLTTPAPHRAAHPLSRRRSAPPPAVDQVAELIVQSEADRAHLAAATETTLSTLSRAADTAAHVLIDYVSNDGTSSRQQFVPLFVGSGMVRLVDRDRGRTLTVPLSRITSARLA